jgi:hypothetical protein
VDAGALTELPVGMFAQFSPRAVLVAADPAAPSIEAARSHLLATGFADVVTMQGVTAAAFSASAAA